MAREYHYCEECNKKTEIWATNRREAQRKLEWWEKNRPLCNDCVGKKEYAEALAKAQELDLPPLKGSPAQIEWAQRIRVPRLVKLLEMTESGEVSLSYFSQYSKTHAADLEAIETVLPYLCSITAADRWTDLYSESLQSIVDMAKKELEESRKPENDPVIRKAVSFETTIRPEEPVTKVITEMRLSKRRDILFVTFPEKREDFNDAIKAFNARWDRPRWYLQSETKEQLYELAAEVGVHLIGCGFPLRVEETPLREKILSGDVQKSDGRRIDYAGADHFRVDWRRIDGDFYDEVRKVPGSKWDKENRTVLVPIASVDELRDFAGTHGFPLTELAQQACQAYDEYRQKGMVSAGKKRDAGKVAEPILDRSAFPATIKIDPSLLDD